MDHETGGLVDGYQMLITIYDGKLAYCGLRSRLNSRGLNSTRFQSILHEMTEERFQPLLDNRRFENPQGAGNRLEGRQSP
jgi:hypothetical protein